MPSPAWEKLSDFFNLSDFAEELVFATKKGEITIAGIYDDALFNNLTGEYEAQVSEPRFPCAEKEAPRDLITRGTKVRMGCQNLEVLDNLPDGTGVTVISLSLAHE